MVASRNVNDYFYLRDTKSWGVSPANEAHLKRFIVRKRGFDVEFTTINYYVEKILSWTRQLGLDDMKEATQDQILEAYFDRQDRVAAGEYSPDTLDGDVIALKQFMQFLHGEEAAKEIVPIARKRKKNTRQSSEYINAEHVRKMRDYAMSTGDVRGVALIMICMGTGARISEILDAKVKDLTIKQFNAVLKVNGKTGERSIPFVVGMPEVMAWITAHPVRMADGRVDPEAPLFVTYNTRGHGSRKLSKKRVEGYFDTVAKKVGIPKEVKSSPHAFRHLLATILAKKLTIKDMNLFFGWSPHSTTALTYIHTSQEDLENSLLSINGITVTNEETSEESFVIQCPACHKILPSGAQWCPQCRLILDPVLAVQVEGIYKDMGQKSVISSYIDGT